MVIDDGLWWWIIMIIDDGDRSCMMTEMMKDYDDGDGG